MRLKRKYQSIFVPYNGVNREVLIFQINVKTNYFSTFTDVFIKLNEYDDFDFYTISSLR